MPHHWISITLGRVCTACSVAQADGEFDDKPECADDKPYAAPERAESKANKKKPR